MTAPIEWDDLIRGRQHFDPALLSDPVIRREDGSWLYMLPSVVDDIDMGVTHVVRGEDHVTNTGLQIQMFEALGAPPPAFAHEALLVGSEGKLSKRLGSLGVEAMREAGIEPVALVAKLARIGTSLPVEPFAEPAPLIESFDFATFGRAPARFDLDELDSAQRPHRPPARRSTRCATGCRRAWPRRTGRRSGPTSRSVAEAADWWEISPRPCRAGGGAPRTATSSPPRPRRRQRSTGATAPWPQLDRPAQGSAAAARARPCSSRSAAR